MRENSTVESLLVESQRAPELTLRAHESLGHGSAAASLGEHGLFNQRPSSAINLKFPDPEKKQIRVLVLEDRVNDAELNIRELRQAGYEPQWERVQTEAEFVARLDVSFDLILADFQLPQFDGLAALRITRQRYPDLPFILVSGSLGEEQAIESLKSGATDYVLKQRISRLAPAVRRALQEAAVRAERKWADHLLQLEHAVVRSFADADTLAMGLQAMLRIVCESQDWRLGIFWRLDRTSERLRFEECWHLSHTEIDPYIAGVRPVEFARGVGLVGRAWEAGAALWASDYSTDERVRQKALAQETGIHGALVVPVTIEGQVMGVLAFMSSAVREPDGRVMAAARSIGSQTGQFLQRKSAEMALQVSERFAKSTLDSLSKHICVLDENGIIIAVNRTWREFSSANGGLAQRTSEGMNYLDVCEQSQANGTEEAKVFASGVREVLAGRQSAFSMEYPCHTPTEQRWFEVRVTLFEDDGPVRIVVAHENITERKRSESFALAIRMISEQMVAGAGLNTIAAMVIKLLEAQIPGALCSILFLDQSGKHLVNAIAPSLPENYTLAINGVEIGADVGSCGTAAFLGRRVIVEDIANDPLWADYKELALAADLHSCWSTPVLSASGRVLGTFAIYQHTVNRPLQHELEMVDTVTHLTGLVIERAEQEQALRQSEARFRLLTEFSDATRLLSEPGEVLDVALRLLGRYLKVNRCVYTEIEADLIHFKILSDFTDGCSSAAGEYELSFLTEGAYRMLTAGETLVIRDIDSRLLSDEGAVMCQALNVQALIACPLLKQGRLEAIMAVHQITSRQWTLDEISLVEEFVERCWTIIEHKRAEERVKRLHRMSNVMSDINALILRVRNRNDLCGEACRIAIDTGKFVKAWIALMNADGTSMNLVASAGVDGPMPERVRSVLEGHLDLGNAMVPDRVVKQRLTKVCNRIADDASIPHRHELVAVGNLSMIWLPLVIADQTVGMLVLHASDIDYFDDDEVKLLQELVGDLSFALEHIAQEEKLNYLAYYDALTGLANRALFHERVAQYIATPNKTETRFEARLALAVINLERFKMINDSLGRQVGDRLLKQVAERLVQSVGDSKLIARISADHFAVLLPGTRTDSEVGRLIGEQYQQCFGRPFLIDGKDVHASAQIGVALYPADGSDAETLYQNAEAAVKNAKGSSERTLFYDRIMTQAVAEKLALENQLRRALENEEFVLHYQPKVDVDTRRILGVEALLRWNSKELGLVPPMKFIPLMEETGLILEVGAWAMRRAALDYQAWVAMGLEAPRIAVNVSAIQLRKLDFVGMVENALQYRHDVESGIDIEITESLIMEDISGNIEKLHALRAMNVSISIDDFGTGYSSLAYLAKLPVQILKIDRAFITAMLGDSDYMTLVSTMISLAHSLRLKVVAEGVESEDEAKILRLLRCDQIQGYLVSKPVPFDAMTMLIQQGA